MEAEQALQLIAAITGTLTVLCACCIIRTSKKPTRRRYVDSMASTVTAYSSNGIE